MHSFNLRMSVRNTHSTPRSLPPMLATVRLGARKCHCVRGCIHLGLLQRSSHEIHRVEHCTGWCSCSRVQPGHEAAEVLWQRPGPDLTHRSATWSTNSSVVCFPRLEKRHHLWASHESTRSTPYCCQHFLKALNHLTLRPRKRLGLLQQHDGPADHIASVFFVDRLRSGVTSRA